jgi:hypothetical protein
MVRFSRAKSSSYAGLGDEYLFRQFGEHSTSIPAPHDVNLLTVPTASTFKAMPVS